MKITVLGAGAWGTALARHLHQGGHALTLWDYDTANLQLMARVGRNEKYLPGIDLSGDWRIEPELDRAWAGSECVVVAVPSRALREVTAVLAGCQALVISVTKGLEYESGLTMSRVLQSNAPRARIAALSGPTFALEVARGIPTAAVAASADAPTAQAVQRLFHRATFRVYTSTDVLGVELGGALKNVIAIAAGVCDGLGFGDNSKAALVTRGIAEVRRLGVACGAQPDTFAGLSGLGDLVVTCFSRLSRNRALGEGLGRGERLAEILARTLSVPEGYPTACAAWRLASQAGIATPIIAEVYAMLYEDKNVAQAVRDLTEREMKAED
jgi:glycerol-3-phosphate dehydrogenase (NAD(P)+)